MDRLCQLATEKNIFARKIIRYFVAHYFLIREISCYEEVYLGLVEKVPFHLCQFSGFVIETSLREVKG